jgi:hypothetical protein
VILSYRQNIAAYPQGASDYIVAKDNLGVFPGLTAGSALLIDYTLTVAVSVSAGVAALTSAFPVLYPYRVALGIGLVMPSGWRTCVASASPGACSRYGAICSSAAMSC